MEPMEVIDLSSDDEKSPPKKQDTGSSSVAKSKKEAENERQSLDDEGVEIICNIVNNKKRPIDEANNICSAVKKIKLSKKEDHSKIVTTLLNDKREITLQRIKRITPETLSPRCTAWHSESQFITGSSNKNSSSPKTNKSGPNSLKNDTHFKGTSPNIRDRSQLFEINEGASTSTQITKPHLVVKNKIKISDAPEPIIKPSAEVFESFLDACRSKDSSKDMDKIISKLKKRFNNLQSSYAKSGSFMQLIRHKRNLILNDCSKLFLHISEVMDEMKARQIQTKSLVEDTNNKSDTKELGTSVQSGLSNKPEAIQDGLMIEDSKDIEKLKALEIAMRRCERRIKKCEEAEVNFDDENDSHYILAEKYKYRMVELYNKYCEITGEKPDAARPYLRPKYLSVTPLPSLNNAITSFINMKITKINKSMVHSKKNAGQIRLTDALIFPDYVDVLNCVKKCNEEQNLQLDKVTQKRIAKTAFMELGKHLQQCRQADYYDTFSLFLEKEDCDPASTDKSLSEKLNKNQEIGKKKLDQVFQEYVEKEYAAKATKNGSCLEKEENIKTGDESSDGIDDEDSDISENDEVGIGVHSDCDENEINDLNTELQHESNRKSDDDVEVGKLQNDSNKKDDNDIEVEEVQDDLNPKRNDDAAKLDKQPDNLYQNDHDYIELDKLRHNLNRKLMSHVGRDKLQDDLKQKGNDNVEPEEPQVNSNNKSDDIVKLTEPVDTNKEIIESEELHDGPNSLSVKKIDDEKCIDKDASEPIADRIVDNAKVTKVKDTEIECITIDQIMIVRKMKKTVNPCDTEETAPLPAPIKEPASTVTTCEVNPMQAGETPEMNTIDESSPAISANKIAVIDAAAVATTVKLVDEEEDKKPILRVRQFAKPPGSWKDFQSPTKNANVNTQTIETKKVDTETKIINETLPTKSQPGRDIKLNKPISAKIKNDIITNLKNKKSTVIIPTTLNRSIPHINVKTVTNNVTFNFNNPAQFEPRITSVTSLGLKPTQNLVNIDESGKITARCGNVAITDIRSDKEKISKVLNPIQTVRNNTQRMIPIKRPASQVRVVGQQNTGTMNLQVISCPADQQKTNIGQVPSFMDERGKVFRIVKQPSPRVNAQNIIVPTKAAVVRNPTTCIPNQRPKSNSPVVADPNLKIKVPNSIKKTISIKVPPQPSNKLDKVYETPTKSVPTYVID